MKHKLIKLVGESWYEVMKDYLHSPSFLQISKFITEERKNYTVYPESEKVFRIFKELKYEDIRVILLGQNPYHDGSACGHSFCNCESLKISPMLGNIIKEINRSYPDNNDRIDIKLIHSDLNYLVKQGVFLYNTGLTVRKGVVDSHLNEWKEFTKEVIKALNKKDKLIYLLLGSYAHKYEKLINCKHTILKYSHPAREIYNPGSFIGCGCFEEVNKYLNKKIIW